VKNEKTDINYKFSIYECPGLAPIGDIVIENPNFVHPTKKTSPSPSQGSVQS
jgi:hypothetical protein